MSVSGLFASVRDVAATLGLPVAAFSEAETIQVEDWIGKTERIIARRLGALENLDQDSLRDVISEVVARRFKNPDGKQNERVDDYGYGLDRETAKNRLYLTDDEWDQLSLDVDGAFTVGMSASHWSLCKPAPVDLGDWV